MADHELDMPRSMPVDLQQHLTVVEVERWKAHTATHERDREVLDRAAADMDTLRAAVRG